MDLSANASDSSRISSGGEPQDGFYAALGTLFCGVLTQSLTPRDAGFAPHTELWTVAGGDLQVKSRLHRVILALELEI